MQLIADNPKPRVFIGRSWMRGPAVWIASVEWGMRVVCDPWTCRYRHGVIVVFDLHALRCALHTLRRVFFVRKT